MILLMICLSISVAFSSEWKCDTITFKGAKTSVCTTYYNSGKVRMIMRENKYGRHGYSEMFYENGQLERKSFYLDDCQKDTIFEYHPDGSVKLVQPAKNCKIHGMFLKISQEGDTLECSQYTEGTPIGMHRYFYAKNRPRALITYDNNGKKNGPEKKWWPNGNLRYEIMYKDNESYSSKGYFENGKPRLIETEYEFKGLSLFIYEAQAFHPNGKSAGTIKKGNGTIINYKEDASMKWKEVYREGKRISRELFE